MKSGDSSSLDVYAAAISVNDALVQAKQLHRWLKSCLSGQFKYDFSDVGPEATRRHVASFLLHPIFSGRRGFCERVFSLYLDIIECLDELKSALEKAKFSCAPKVLASVTRLAAPVGNVLDNKSQIILKDLRKRAIDFEPNVSKCDFSDTVSTALRSLSEESMESWNVTWYRDSCCASLIVVLSVLGQLSPNSDRSKSRLEQVSDMGINEVIAALCATKHCTTPLVSVLADISNCLAPVELAILHAAAVARGMSVNLEILPDAQNIELHGLRPSDFAIDVNAPKIDEIKYGSQNVRSTAQDSGASPEQAALWSVWAHQAGLPVPTASGAIPIFRKIRCAGPVAPSAPGYGSGAASAARLKWLSDELAADPSTRSFGVALGHPTATTPKIARKLLAMAAAQTSDLSCLVINHNYEDDKTAPTNPAHSELPLHELCFPSGFIKLARKNTLPHVANRGIELSRMTFEQRIKFHNKALSNSLLQYAVAHFPVNLFRSQVTQWMLAERLSGRRLLPRLQRGNFYIEQIFPNFNFPFGNHTAPGSNAIESGSCFHSGHHASEDRDPREYLRELFGCIRENVAYAESVTAATTEFVCGVPITALTNYERFFSNIDSKNTLELKAAIARLNLPSPLKEIFSDLITAGNDESQYLLDIILHLDLSLTINAKLAANMESSIGYPRQGGNCWEFKNIRPIVLTEHRGAWGALWRGVSSFEGAPLTISLGAGCPNQIILLGHNSSGKSTCLDNLAFAKLCDANALPFNGGIGSPDGSKIFYVHRHGIVNSLANQGLETLRLLASNLSAASAGDLIMVDEFPGVPPSWMSWLLPSIAGYCRANGINLIVVTHALTDEIAQGLFTSGVGFWKLDGKGSEPRTVQQCRTIADVLSAPFGDRAELVLT